MKISAIQILIIGILNLVGTLLSMEDKPKLWFILNNTLCIESCNQYMDFYTKPHTFENCVITRALSLSDEKRNEFINASIIAGEKKEPVFVNYDFDGKPYKIKIIPTFHGYKKHNQAVYAKYFVTVKPDVKKN